MEQLLTDDARAKLASARERLRSQAGPHFVVASALLVAAEVLATELAALRKTLAGGKAGDPYR